MNCSTVRRTLLAQERLSMGAGEARHLSGCPACRAWHRRLVRIEQQLPLVAVPACPVPSSLLDALQSPPLRVFGTAPPPDRQRRLEGGRKKLALAFALAASLAVFAVGWWAWPGQRTLPTRPVVTAPDPYPRVRDQKLAPARSATARAALLADLADEFFAEARQKKEDPARLAVLARQFDRLVGEDLIHHVGLVPQNERRAVASMLAQRMSVLQSEASRLALEWTPKRAAAVASLRRIVNSARAAEDRLRRFA